MSGFQLCKGPLCLAENDFGLPRTRDSFRAGSKVCERCEGEVPLRPPRPKAVAESRPQMAPMAADEEKAKPKMKETIVEKKCGRCGVTKPLVEFNKIGPCKACKRERNIADREQRKARAAGGAKPESAAPTVRRTPRTKANTWPRPEAHPALKTLADGIAGVAESTAQLTPRQLLERLVRDLTLEAARQMFPGLVREALAEALR